MRGIIVRNGQAKKNKKKELNTAIIRSNSTVAAEASQQQLIDQVKGKKLKLPLITFMNNTTYKGEWLNGMKNGFGELNA